jgi:hypothetical protein
MSAVSAGKLFGGACRLDPPVVDSVRYQTGLFLPSANAFSESQVDSHGGGTPSEAV